MAERQDKKLNELVDTNEFVSGTPNESQIRIIDSLIRDKNPYIDLERFGWIQRPVSFDKIINTIKFYQSQSFVEERIFRSYKNMSIALRFVKIGCDKLKDIVNRMNRLPTDNARVRYLMNKVLFTKRTAQNCLNYVGTRRFYANYNYLVCLYQI